MIISTQWLGFRDPPATQHYMTKQSWGCLVQLYTQPTNTLYHMYPKRVPHRKMFMGTDHREAPRWGGQTLGISGVYMSGSHIRVDEIWQCCFVNPPGGIMVFDWLTSDNRCPTCEGRVVRLDGDIDHRYFSSLGQPAGLTLHGELE